MKDQFTVKTYLYIVTIDIEISWKKKTFCIFLYILSSVIFSFLTNFLEKPYLISLTMIHDNKYVAFKSVCLCEICIMLC